MEFSYRGRLLLFLQELTDIKSLFFFKVLQSFLMLFFFPVVYRLAAVNYVKMSSLLIKSKFLEMWAFTLTIKVKILVKKKSNSESILSLKGGLKVKIVRSLVEA